jgi:hypothetical protein
LELPWEALMRNTNSVYRKGQLRLEPGMVMYWAQGKQICNLKPLDYNDMVQAAALYNAHVGEFWWKMYVDYFIPLQ